MMTVEDPLQRRARPARRACATTVAVVLVVLLTACASKPAPVVPEAAAHPRSVAIVPVMRSEDLTIIRRSPVGFLGAIPLLIERVDRVQKQRVFETQYDADRDAVARVLTQSLLESAKRRGFDAVVLEPIALDADNPDAFDDPRIGGDADAVIFVRIADMGLLNPMTSIQYEPYIDLKVRIVARASRYEMLDDSFCFGATCSKDDPTAVPSDPTERYPDFDAIVANPERLSATWAKGADALGRLIVSTLPAPIR